MDLQTALTIGGIIITVLFGIWAIVATVRYSKAVKITFALDKVIALTNDITQNFPDLQIAFRDKPMSENLVLLKGYFLNAGKKDISREMVEESISIDIPPGFEWVDCKIVERSPSFEVKVRGFEDTKVPFEMGLWKAGEFFKFEALAKVPVLQADPDHIPAVYPTSRLVRGLSFSHRIADCEKIHETWVPANDSIALFPFGAPWLTARRAFIALALICLLFGTASWGFIRFYPNMRIGYKAVMDGQERQLVVWATEGKIRVSDRQGYIRDLTLDEFNNLPKKALVIAWRDPWLTVVVSFFFALGLWLLGSRAIRNAREKRLLSRIARRERT